MCLKLWRICFHIIYYYDLVRNSLVEKKLKFSENYFLKFIIKIYLSRYEVRKE